MPPGLTVPVNIAVVLVNVAERELVPEQSESIATKIDETRILQHSSVTGLVLREQTHRNLRPAELKRFICV
jgi:hypothetical protein